jgi:two-component system, LuxR family, response regulator FixJ
MACRDGILDTLNDTVYIVDDDEAVRESLAALLETHGFAVEAFASGDAFQERAPAALHGCVILDLQLPHRNGLQILDWLRRTLHSDIPVLLMTGHGDKATRASAHEAGVNAYLEKPFDVAALADMIKAIFAERGRAVAAV